MSAAPCGRPWTSDPRPVRPSSPSVPLHQHSTSRRHVWCHASWVASPAHALARRHERVYRHSAHHQLHPARHSSSRGVYFACSCGLRAQRAVLWIGAGCCLVLGRVVPSCSRRNALIRCALQVVELEQVGRATDRHRVPRITHLANYPNLQRVNLSGNMIRHADGLSSLRNLTSLNLSANRIRDLQGLCVSSLSSLRSLDVSGNFISRIPDGACSRPCDAPLRHLWARPPTRTRSRMRVIGMAGMKVMASLTELRLAGNNLGVLKDVHHLSPLGNLVCLNMSANPFCDLPHYQRYDSPRLCFHRGTPLRCPVHDTAPAASSATDTSCSSSRPSLSWTQRQSHKRSAAKLSSSLIPLPLRHRMMHSDTANRRSWLCLDPVPTMPRMRS